MNVWANEWSENQTEGRKRGVVDGTGLGATLYELSKGGGIAHHEIFSTTATPSGKDYSKT